jgi:hypothetical protein
MRIEFLQIEQGHACIIILAHAGSFYFSRRHRAGRE